MGHGFGKSRPRDAAVAVATTALLLASFAGRAGAQIGLGRITGTVKDDTGVPIRGALVTAHNPDSAPTTFTTTTDEKGRFAILGLRRGVWTIAAKAAGYEPQEFTGPIQPQRAIPPIEFVLRPTPAPGPRGALAGVDVARLREEVQRAAALAAAGDLEPAVRLYEKIVQEVPALTAVYGELGDLYARLRRPEAALAAYEKQLAASPEDEEAKAAVGRLALELGLLAAARRDVEAAAKYLERAIAVAPESPRAAEARAALERLRR
jgi:tetratricopeptide (TPR) repeat protein